MPDDIHDQLFIFGKKDVIEKDGEEG